MKDIRGVSLLYACSECKLSIDKNLQTRLKRASKQAVDRPKRCVQINVTIN